MGGLNVTESIASDNEFETNRKKLLSDSLIAKYTEASES